jgi:hypothetical protein
MTKIKKSKTLATLLIGTCLFSLISCGSDDDDSGSASGSGAPQEQQEQPTEGVYRAVLTPINSSVAGSTSGVTEIRITGEDVVVEGAVTGAPAGVKHLQAIHMEGSCPTVEADDANGDGFVDIEESLPRFGQILIPLDSNLDSQTEGMTYGPIANGSGSYIYRRSTSLSELESDLRTLDANPDDQMTKLPEGQNLNLAGRTVVVYGVSSLSNLPNSVATLGDNTAAQSLPIACGQLERQEDTGETTEGEGQTTGGTTAGEGQTTGGTTAGEGQTTGGTTAGEGQTTGGTTGA